MEEITDYSAHLDHRLVLLFAGLVAAAFIFLLVFDNIRRRRRLHGRGLGRDRGSSSRPGFFKRTAGSFRDLREEMERRGARKSRRHDRRK